MAVVVAGEGRLATPPTVMPLACAAAMVAAFEVAMLGARLLLPRELAVQHLVRSLTALLLLRKDGRSWLE